MTRKLLLLLALGLAAHYFWGERGADPGPGVLAPEAPRQVAVSGAAEVALGRHILTPVAEFSLQARVLGREDYSLDREAELAPTDLALGWGPMSDSAVLQHFDISQSGRFYRWRAQTLPIPYRDVVRHSANMHLIPADETVGEALEQIRPGHVIRLSGYLVNARSSDGWRWKSSTSREDSGAGACEVILVRRLEIIAPEAI